MEYLCTLYGSRAEMAPPARSRDDEIATLTVRNGRIRVISGSRSGWTGADPRHFALEARDLNDAIRLAARHPAAVAGWVEIRPLRRLVTR
jgi:hypothetical protein